VLEEITMVRGKTPKSPSRNIILSPGKPKSIKRNFVLEYLGACKEEYDAGKRLEEGEYVQGMFNSWRLYCQQLGIPAGAPTAFRQVVMHLKRDGAIEHYATRPADQAHFWPRNYYRVILE
jgi:hypothetical protein